MWEQRYSFAAPCAAPLPAAACLFPRSCGPFCKCRCRCRRQRQGAFPRYTSFLSLDSLRFSSLLFHSSLLFRVNSKPPAQPSPAWPGCGHAACGRGHRYDLWESQKLAGFRMSTLLESIGLLRCFQGGTCTLNLSEVVMDQDQSCAVGVIELYLRSMYALMLSGRCQYQNQQRE